MATRKPPPDNARTRAIVRMLEGKSKEPSPVDKPSRKKTARPKGWDGADDEAFDILSIATADALTMTDKRMLIASRLRKIAQGSRKWGVLR